MDPKLKANFDRVWRSGWVGSVVSAFLGLALLHPAVPWLRLLSYDTLALFTPAPRPTEVVIVYMDEDSYAKLDQPVHGLWDRRLHAELIRQLLKAEVQAIAFDVLFDRPAPGQDTAFASALREAGNRVVLAAKLENSEVGISYTARPILPALSLGTDLASGMINFPEEAFGIVRRQIEFPHPNHASLALKLAHLTGGLVREPSETSWIRYYGGSGSIPACSYSAVLSNTVTAQSLAGKVVFVGRGNLITAEGPLQTDFHRTPSAWLNGRLMAGVEIHATSFLNLQRHEWWTELPSIVEAILVAGVGVGFGRWFARVGWWRSTPRALGGIAVVLFVAVATALVAQVWFAWLVVALVQIPCAVLLARVAPLRRRLDAFISYRRNDIGYALWLRSELARQRVSSYMDVSELSPGAAFRAELKDAISEAPVFIILISGTTLDRCWLENDVMAQEISEATERRRRIVPILLNGFSWTKQAFNHFPASLAAVPNRRNELPMAVTSLKEHESIEHIDKAAVQTVQRLLRVFQ